MTSGKSADGSSMDIKGQPAACVCKGVGGVIPLVGRARAMSKGDSFIVLLDSESTDRSKLLPAYINAVVRHREGMARSNTLAMEILLLASGDTNIAKAIETNGARDYKEFIVFTSGRELMNDFVKREKLEVEAVVNLSLDLDSAGDVATTELFED